MHKILITGATGNVGREVVEQLLRRNDSLEVIAAVRNPEKAKKEFSDDRLKFRTFDFKDSATFEKAFNGINKLFLLRPPYITNIDEIFKPIISEIKKSGVKEIMFLSVQGAERFKFIPHHKIEELIIESGLDYVFLRPSYFMQNLTTILLDDINEKNKIILPAGKAKFNWIDVKNAAEVAAKILDNSDKYKNSAYEITGYENLNFYDAAKIISKVIGRKVDYENVNPFTFYLKKRREGENRVKILVMAALHFLPRFQKEPEISRFYEELMKKLPTSLQIFVEREKELFMIEKSKIQRKL